MLETVARRLLGSELTLPALPAGVVGNRVLTGGSATVTQDKASLKVVLDEAALETPIDRIIELELAGDALGIAPVETKRSQSLTRNATASASSEFSHKRPSGKRVTDSAANVAGKEEGRGGNWTALEDDREPWIEVELKNPAAFQQIYLVEQHTRVRQFELQCRDEGDDRWQTLYRGGRMNYCSVRLPESVTARNVRVVVQETAGGPPQISRFDLFQ